ncbi:MAG: helix-turn-helix transcriptional regulator [Pseudomonadota bacterium]
MRGKETPEKTQAVDIPQTLGRNVRRLRRERKLTQEALAFAAGMDQAQLSGIESGACNLTLRVIARLANALNVPPAALFDGS